ncbi:hypothetical protein L1887_13513 [Cichorium endivia]|nr:hypothetical protein L1887_13513 [Cichorium endivia]
MAASVQFRQEEMSSGETKEKEKGDDLSLFVDFNGANLNSDLHKKSNHFEEILDSDFDNTLMPETKSIIMHGDNPGADDLLNSENNATTDYDWLLSPPRIPVLSLDMEEQKTLASQILISNGQKSTSPESRLENPSTDNTSTTKVAPKLPSSSIKSSIRRPSPSRKAPSTISRSSTPTTRPTIPSTTKPSRSSTPTPRPTIATTKPVPPTKRSTTPTVSSARSSTPTARPSILPASKSASRSSTPTPRPSIISVSKPTSRSSTPTSRPINPPANTGRSSSVTKPRAPPNIKKSLPERPVSASRGRPGPTETSSKPIPKRTSSSPSRGPVSNGVKSGVTRSRGNTIGNDDVNPVLMGTKMVERVVNMRKLAPPREDRVSNQNNQSGKLSGPQDNSGFGRTLSKKSFDMALRHLDIRRSMPGNMRAMITKVPASSVYSVRSESTKNHTISASDSPLATSSSASSDHSISNNARFIDQY